MRVLKRIRRDNKIAGYLISYNNMELAIPTSTLYTQKYSARLIRSGYIFYGTDGEIEDSDNHSIKNLPEMDWETLDENSKLEWYAAEKINENEAVSNETINFMITPRATEEACEHLHSPSKEVIDKGREQIRKALSYNDCMDDELAGEEDYEEECEEQEEENTEISEERRRELLENIMRFSNQYCEPRNEEQPSESDKEKEGEAEPTLPADTSEEVNDEVPGSNDESHEEVVEEINEPYTNEGESTPSSDVTDEEKEKHIENAKRLFGVRENVLTDENKADMMKALGVPEDEIQKRLDDTSSTDTDSGETNIVKQATKDYMFPFLTKAEWDDGSSMLGKETGKVIDNGKLVGITINVNGQKVIPLEVLYFSDVMKTICRAGGHYDDMRGDITFSDGRRLLDLPYKDFSIIGKFDYVYDKPVIKKVFNTDCIELSERIEEEQPKIELLKKILSTDGTVEGVYANVGGKYCTLCIEELYSPKILKSLTDSGYLRISDYNFLDSRNDNDKTIDDLPEMSSFVVNKSELEKSKERVIEMEKDFIRRMQNEINAQNH